MFADIFLKTKITSSFCCIYSSSKVKYKLTQKLIEILKELDESVEGLLSMEELKKDYKNFFTDSLINSEFDEIIKTIEQDKNGQISIEEFLSATVNYEN